MIEVLDPGLYSTIQDRGRSGFYARGVPPSGAMDLFAHESANILVGNNPDAATIECTFLGPTLTFREFGLVAITGADVDVTLDGVAVPPWMSQVIRAGQTLRFGAFRAGARAYLSVRGGVDVPLVMGSRSTYVASGLGGQQGRTLEAGDALPIGHLVAPGTSLRGGVEVPESMRPHYAREAEIRVVPGLCDYRLSSDAVRDLYSTPYSVSVEANRTGYRFSGKALEFLDRQILADRDVAHEADVVAERGRFVATAHALDRLVIGRDAGTDQPVRHRQGVENVDPHIVAPLFLRGFGGVISRWTRADDRDVAGHAARRSSSRSRKARMQDTDCSRWLSRNK